MKLIACLTVLLSIAAKGEFQLDCSDEVWNQCRKLDEFYVALTCSADGKSLFSQWKSPQCRNSEGDDNLYFRASRPDHPCCPKHSLSIKPDPNNGLGDTDTLECSRQDEVIKVKTTVLTAACNGDNDVLNLEFFGSDNPISTACDGKPKCDASMVKDWKTSVNLLGGITPCNYDEAQLDIEYRCYNKYTPSFDTDRNLLTTVNANCINGGEIELINTCSKAAQSYCNGRSSCSYPITSGNSPECGNHATSDYKCN